MTTITAIGFDADDTLWHNETLYHTTQEKFRTLLAPYHDAEWIDRKLYETEMRNLQRFGYGIKGFTLSMIETAIELTQGRVQAAEIQQIIGFAKEMMAAPVELLPCVRQTLTALAGRDSHLLITKGDLFHQEAKLARSVVGPLRRGRGGERSTSTPTPPCSANTRAARPVPHGRQLRPLRHPAGSGLSAQAVHIPYHITWQHEEAEPHEAAQDFYTLDSLCELNPLLERLAPARRAGR